MTANVIGDKIFVFGGYIGEGKIKYFIFYRLNFS